MLSNNHARLEGVNYAGCKECIAKHKQWESQEEQELQEQKAWDHFCDQIILAVDDRHGSYIWSTAMDLYSHRIVDLLSDENTELRMDVYYAMNEENIGTDEYYWCMESIEDNAVFEIDGKHYKLISNGDLWFIPVDLDIPEGWFI